MVPEEPDSTLPPGVVTASPLLFSTWVPPVETVVPVEPGAASTLPTEPSPSTVVLEPAVVTWPMAAPLSALTLVPSAEPVTDTCSTVPDTVREPSWAEAVTEPTCAPSATVRLDWAADSDRTTASTCPVISTEAPGASTVTAERDPSSFTAPEPWSTSTVSTEAVPSTDRRTPPLRREMTAWAIRESPVTTTEFSPPPRTTRRPSTVTFSRVMWPSPTPSPITRSPATWASFRVTPSARTARERP